MRETHGSDSCCAMCSKWLLWPGPFSCCTARCQCYRISLVGNGNHNVMCFNYSFHLKQKVFHIMQGSTLETQLGMTRHTQRIFHVSHWLSSFNSNRVFLCFFKRPPAESDLKKGMLINRDITVLDRRIWITRNAFCYISSICCIKQWRCHFIFLFLCFSSFFLPCPAKLER